MTHTRSLFRRGGVALATAGLLSTGLVGLASSASAVETGDADGGALSWGISTYLNSANMGRPNPHVAGYVAPATFDSTTRISTWGEASGTLSEDGTADVTFAGASVNFAPTSGAWIRLSDLQVEVDSAGTGTLSAVVAYGQAPGTYPGIVYDAAQTPQRGPERVDLVDLSGNSAADVAVSEDDVAWTGLDGAWSPDFVDFVDGDTETSVPAFIYAGQINSNTDRTPLPVSFDVDRAEPSVGYETTGANYGDGLELAVSGDGFRGVTNAGPPADDGVYVGLAEGNELPDVSSMEGMDAFVDVAWVTKGAIVDGSFATVLNAATADLDPAKEYSIFTWQAHTHSNTTQDTVTPVEIDFADLQPVASAVTVGGATGTTYGKTAVVTAAVPAKGTVTLTGLGATQTKTLAAAGTASFTVPASLAAGSYTATFAYSGGSEYTGSQATKAFSVAKATTRTVVKVAPKPTAKKAGRATVTVAGVAAGSKVVLTVKGPGKTVKKTVKVNANGKAVIALAKAPKGGSFAVTAAYAGDADHVKSSDKASYKVKKPKKAKKR